MAKKQVTAIVKIQIPAGKATPAPPVGTALGPHGLNIMEFVKQYNAATESQAGTIVPVEITVFNDRTFTFVLKTPPAPVLTHVVRSGRTHRIGPLVGQSDRDSRYRGARLADLSAQASVIGLSQKRGCAGDQYNAVREPASQMFHRNLPKERKDASQGRRARKFWQ